MNNQSQGKRQIIRNLIIYIIIVVGIGWIALWINGNVADESSQGPGMLLWLVAPLAASFLLRAFAGDGWKDLGIKPRFKGNGLWYAVSIFMYPVLIAIVLLIGSAVGKVSLQGFNLKGGGTFIQALIIYLVVNLFKNIFEEFGWRGYLAPKVNKLGWNPFAAGAGCRHRSGRRGSKRKGGPGENEGTRTGRGAYGSGDARHGGTGSYPQNPQGIPKDKGANPDPVR